MKPTRRVSRRSFLRQVTGGALTGGVAFALAGCRQAGEAGNGAGSPLGNLFGGGRGAKGPEGVTDRDPNDPVGRGRGGSRGGGSGVTDGDPNDPVGRGRGGRPPGSGVTDRDPTDPIGRGRGGSGGRAATGVTDRDPTDPVGGGRGGARGPGAAPVQQGVYVCRNPQGGRTAMSFAILDGASYMAATGRVGRYGFAGGVLTLDSGARFQSVGPGLFRQVRADTGQVGAFTCRLDPVLDPRNPRGW